ncbi:uncharacterized protein [Physcomitrium patens]|uniref:S1 motif domain-containing protein n=1 Tax=Physcomitrium patens TaxID=3218 RepID=A0A2K1K4G1_PHYPA|nr:uncharacterized protein LOC112286594 isoform X1 [Physcomitrium patens]PNR48669.1 hypothetical protein PHYPA_013146 [Physcomitrium patens]|eukprot:XP_024384357.1 uncharacterized protein LOC112286594 isoform X1 [Physcomitrella patens]
MAQHTCSFQCPLARGCTLRYSQVGAGKALSSVDKLSNRTPGLVELRRRCDLGFQRSRLVRVVAMGRKSMEVGKGGENERPELKLETADLMELEFGKLLGEPRHVTLAKVVGRKLNPEVPYVESEKKTLNKIQDSQPEISEAEFCRLLNQEGSGPLRGVKNPAVESSEDLPGLVKPPSRPGQISFSEAEFSRLVNQDSRSRVEKPTVENSEDLPGLVKPPSRPGSRRASSVSSAQTSPAASRKKAVPLVTFGPGGFAAQSKKPLAEENNYMGHAQKPAIPSPDSIKPSWPKNDSVPPMLLGKSTKEADDDYLKLVQKPTIRPVAAESARAVASDAVASDGRSSVNEPPQVPFLTGKLLRVKLNGKASANTDPVMDGSPLDIPEERFGELLRMADSTANDEEVPSEISTTLAATVVGKPRKKKPTPKLGSKPMLAAKPPLKVDESGEVARRHDLSIPSSTSSNDVPNSSVDSPAADLEEIAEPMLSGSDAASVVDLRTPDEKSTDVAKLDNADSYEDESIMKLVKKASLIAPVRLPKRIVKSIPGPVKAKIGDAQDSRMAGWSDEFKAAVKRSEAALPDIGARRLAGTEFDQLDQRKRAALRQRPLARSVPPSVAGTSVDSTGASTQQRVFSRSVISNPEPPHSYGATIQDLAAGSSERAGTYLSDNQIPLKQEDVDKDWARAEALQESRTVEEVVFTKALKNSMLVNFGFLQGFVPAYELSSRRRPPSFTTWAQDNGHIINRKMKLSVASENHPNNDSEDSKEIGRTDSDDEEYKKLLQQYEEARANLLRALVGETAKVVVVAVDRERKQLRFSEKEAEGEGRELAEKKAQLMASLNVGDVVKCTVKKVTSFGAFVELRGIPALIHISELSWNRVTEPSTILNDGVEVEVKVCRLDRYLQRINLSLKQMQPDPLLETLESLVSSDFEETPTSGEVPNGTETTGMPELIEVIRRLEELKGIESVLLGRRIQGTALAPTFQVYLSGQLDDGFKLLARSGNQVQEVLVQTALDRESMKDAIRQCTFSDV